MVSSRLQQGLRMLAVAAAFVAAGRLSLLLAFAGNVVSPLWLPAGVSLASILLLGWRVWPGVALGAFLTNLMTGAPVLFCFAAAIGNTVEAVGGAWLLGRAAFDVRLERPRDVLALSTLAAIGSPALSALLGVSALCASGISPWSAFGPAWTIWWLGDAMGVLLGAPVLLTWLSGAARVPALRRNLEAVALLIAGVLTSTAVFSGVLGRAWESGPVALVLFPVIIWSALRFGARGAATLVMTISVMAIWSRAHGLGPFADRDWFESTKFLQTSLGTMGLSALLLAALVAERERSRLALEHSEARHRSVLDHVKEVVFQTDAGGRWLFLNPAWTELTGFTVEESLGSDPLSYVHPDEREAARSRYRALQERHTETVLWELRVRTRDGGYRWIETHARPRVDADGQVSGTSGTLIDITDRKRAEAERLHLEEQLMQAQKMESIGQLAGGVAHDFNNILTAVIGCAELLSMRLAPDDERRRLVEEIRTAAERAASLTRQLLAFGRRQVIEPRVLDLNDTLRDLAEMLHRVLGEDIALRLDLCPSVGRIDADPSQLSQIILNLAINARDAMPQGGQLTLGTGCSGPEVEDPACRRVGLERYATITITDTGVGMSPEVLAHIFEPFYTTKEPGKGSGLGLSTVYGIVRQSGGQIEVESRPGRGATFRIHLPVASGEASPRAPRAPVEAVGSRKERVLLVEDNDLVRGILVEALESHGHQVSTAASAEEALEQIEGQGLDFEVLVTDVVLAGIHGPALAERLRKLRPGRPVVFMTGYDFNFVSRDERVPEGVFLLQKPFPPAALAEKVHQALEGQRATRA